MEYVRKVRWANYGTIKCKEYLRKDFAYECAYCKLTESVCGDVGEEFFEIDHFKPQKNNEGDPSIHAYSNLYYSCKSCNREKSDIWDELLLDPCKHDIFKNEIHIYSGYDDAKMYMYEWKTNEGEFFINTFKLNSRNQIRRRKRRKKYENNIRIKSELIDEILLKLGQKENIPNKDELVCQLNFLRREMTSLKENLYKNEYFEDISTYLTNKNIEHEIIFEEYNIDLKVKLQDKTIYCELIIDECDDFDEIKLKYIDKKRLKNWYVNFKNDFGILYYFSKANKLYIYPVSSLIKEEELEVINKKKQIRLNIDYLV